MRFVALALILLSLPVFIALLKRYPHRRDWAVAAIGLLMFCVGTIGIDAAFITWPLWLGTSKGILVSPVDMLSIALIATRLKPRARTHHLWLVPLFMLPSFLSLVVSYNPLATLFVPIQIARTALMAYALAGEIHRPATMRALFTGVALGLMIQGGHVVYQKLTGVLQARGTADHQNILGLMVEASLLPLFALALEGDRRKIVYLGLIAGLVIVAGGGSRATILLAPAGLAVLLILSIAKRSNAHKMKILGFLVLAGAVAVPLALGTLNDRFGDRSMSGEDDARWSFERAAIAMADDHPFGIGANNYVTIVNVGGYSRRADVEWGGGGNLTAPVHNAYLLMRAETGWLGEGVMLLVIVVPILAGLGLAFRNRGSPMAGVALGSTVAMLTIAIHINFEYAWHLEAVQRLFFMNLAILSAAAEACRQARVQARRKPLARPARDPLPAR